MFILSEKWKEVHPEARAGTLIMRNVRNIPTHPQLETGKQALEKELHANLGSKEETALKTLPPVQAYTTYYKRFKKTYPLLQQLKSIVIRQQPFPRVSGLVDAMFMAEMKNLLLTAGHDLGKIVAPVQISAAAGDEQYVKLSGETQTAKRNDMIMSDGAGVISSVLYGPDARTMLTLKTGEVLFAVYAPAGIDRASIYNHLEDIRENILLFSPQAEAEPIMIHSL
jgi:DNA/RNA-binding domain of Phe-tRNA-synthetase-like protein